MDSCRIWYRSRLGGTSNLEYHEEAKEQEEIKIHMFTKHQAAFALKMLFFFIRVFIKSNYPDLKPCP